MQKIFDLLNYFGLPINMSDNTHPLALIALGFLIFNIIALFSLINISVYLISLYLINTNKYIDEISNKYPYIHKIIKFYNNSRISFILFPFGGIFIWEYRLYDILMY
uniref:hypothetical protein n=1 Tax=Dichomitus squalens TaxID=114155 RepID=UPI003002C1B0|nr:hypothetical protein [Dichomitus squalens]